MPEYVPTIVEMLGGYRYVESTGVRTPPRHEVKYYVQDLPPSPGEATPQQVIEMIRGLVPTTYGNVPRQSWEVTECIDDYRVFVRAIYQSTQMGSAGELLTEEFSFDTGGGTERMTLALEVKHKSDSMPDVQGAIGFDGERVNGVDVPAPLQRFSVRKQYRESDVDAAFRAVIDTLSTKINNAVWNGYPKGSVLFLNASGSLSRGIYTITYNFESRRPRTEPYSLGGLTIPAHEGYDWVDVYYENAADEENLFKKPCAFQILQIKEYGDFSALNLTIPEPAPE